MQIIHTKIRRSIFSISLLLLSHFSLFAQAVEEPSSKMLASTISFAKVDSQVTFASVTQLPYYDYQQKIAYGDDDNQYALFWPAQNVPHHNVDLKPEAKPLVVLIHGGCWLSAFDIKHSYPLASALSQAGYPVWGLEYRRTGNAGGGWPGTYEDIITGISKVVVLSSTETPFNLDAGIVLIGHSAGGHLALLAGEHFNKNPLPKLSITGTLGLAAITDIKAYSEGKNSCQTATPRFMGGTYNERNTAYDAANPALKSLPKSVVLLAGGQDKIVPLTQSHLKSVKRDEEVSAGHFDWIHPGTQAYARLLKNLESFN